MGNRFIDLIKFPIKLPIAAGLLLLFPCVGVVASPPTATLSRSVEEKREVQENRLRRVTEEIEQLRGRLTDQHRQEKNLLDLLGNFDLESRLLELELQELEGRVSETRRSLERKRHEMEICELRVEEEKDDLASWLRGMYTRGPAPYLSLLLGARDADELLHAYRYASFLTSSEAERLEGFRRTLEDLQEARTRLEKEESRLSGLRAEVEERRVSLRRARRRKGRELDRIRQQTDLVDRLVRELSETENELRLLLTNLLPGGSPGWPSGPGIQRFKGFLEWPVDGRISVPFGERLHPRFGTVTPHPGVSLFVPSGQEIHAVFDGTVVYGDWFRGYGNLVILDHGDGYLSIYAHTSRLLVRSSQEVLQGEVIAMTGETGSLEGPKLYFEIREKGSPVDPAEWFRKQ